MGKLLKTSPEGRKCLAQDCTQILSIYNHEAYCHSHRDQMPQKQTHKIVEVVPTPLKHSSEW
jgi:hypothetical protein